MMFLLGTDRLGRDMLSRIIFGARVSLTIGLLGITVSFILGIVIGGLAGYYGGWIDDALMRITEFFQTIPYFVFAIVLVAILSPSKESIVLAIAVVSQHKARHVGRKVHFHRIDLRLILLGLRHQLIEQRLGFAVIAAIEQDWLVEQARKHKVLRSVEFVGRVDHEGLVALLHDCDAAVLPSHYEPFGIVALEAAATGAPLATSNVGGLGEAVIDGETGMSFPPRDIGALTTAVRVSLS